MFSKAYNILDSLTTAFKNIYVWLSAGSILYAKENNDVNQIKI